MVTNCSTECSFFQTESRLQTLIAQERLVKLVIMSIESDILHEIDFAAFINNFAVTKSRKLSDLWIMLTWRYYMHEYVTVIITDNNLFDYCHVSELQSRRCCDWLIT